MAKNNQDILTLGRISQHVHVRCERVRAMPTRPLVDATSFDGLQGWGSQPYASTFRSHLSQASISRGDVSPAYEASEAPKAYETNQEELIADEYALVDDYSGGPFVTLLLYFYGDHVARHV